MENIQWEFVIALIATAISLYSLYVQRRSDRNSVRPIAVIVKYNYSEYISVKLWNKGTGPLIIDSLEFEGKNNLIDALPDEVLKFKFVEYINAFKGRAISPTESLNLIEFRIRKDTNGKELDGYRHALSLIKQSLNSKTVFISYQDILRNKFKYVSEPLNYSDSKDERLA